MYKRQALRAALAVFNARAGGDDAKKYEDTIRERTSEKLRVWIENNHARSRAACGEKLAALHEGSLAKRSGKDAASGAYTDVASIRFDVKTLATQYLVGAPGPARDAALAEYLQGPAADTYVWLFSRSEDEHEAKLGEMEQGLADATQKLAAVEAREKVYTDSIEAQQKEMVTLSTQKMQLEAEKQAQETRLTSMLEEMQRSNKRQDDLRGELDDAKEALASEQTWQMQLQTRLEDLDASHATKEAKVTELHRILEDSQSQLRDHAAKIEASAEREREVQSKLDEAHRSTKDAQAKHASALERHAELEQAHAATKREKEQLSAELSAKHEAHEGLQAELHGARRQHKDVEAQLADAAGAHGETKEALKAQLAREEELLSKLESEAAAAEAALKTTRDQVATLERELDSEKAAHSETLSVHAELQQTHLELQKLHTSLQNDHKTLQSKTAQKIQYLKTQARAPPPPTLSLIHI